MAARTLGHFVESVVRRIGFGAALGLPQEIATTSPISGSTGSGAKRAGVVPIRGESPASYTNTGYTVRIRGFERHPVVSACVRACVDIAATIPLQAYKKRSAADGRVDVDLLPESHPLQMLVNSPSPFYSRRRFAAMRFTHFLIYGNAALYFERLRGEKQPPTELRIVHPECFQTAWIDARGYPLFYQWSDHAGTPYTTPVTDLLLLRDLTAAKSAVFGYPRAASALSDIIGDDEASQHVRQVVTNHGAPTAYALVDAETTQEQAEQAETRLYEKMVTRGNRGRFLFLGVKDVKSVGFNLRELEFPDLRKIAREDICAAFGVDPRMVGIASASNDAGLSGVQYREARARLVQHTIEPMLEADVSELNHWLAPEFGDVWLRYDPDALKALVEDDQATSTRVIGEVRANLRTIEEARTAVGLPAEYETDDTLLATMGASLIPTVIALAAGEASGEASTAASTAIAENGGAPPAAAIGDGDDDEDDDDDDDTDDDEPTLEAGDGKERKAVGPRTQRLLDRTHHDPRTPAPRIKSITVVTKPAQRSLVLTRSIVLTQELRDLLWRQFDERAVREEAAYRRQALMLFGEERANVARVFERAIGERALRADGDDVDEKLAKGVQRTLRLLYKGDGEIEQRWTERYHPLIGQTFAKGAEHVASGTRSIAASTSRAKAPPKKGDTSAAPSLADPLGYDFHLEAPDVQQAIVERAKRLAALVGRTTAEAINDAIVIGVRNHMSISEIADLVDKTAFGGYAGYRATLIARTETIGALNHGQYFAADESGVVEGKEWLTQGDDRVRDTHADCEHEGVIAMPKPFSNGLQYPGDAAGDAADIINCRCTLLYYDTVTGD